MIEVKNLSFSYGAHKVLQDVSFSVPTGCFLSVLGPNGVGKSTLFSCILGLLQPQSGSILIDGLDISRLRPGERAKHLAYLPQSHNPVFQYSVLDMALMGANAQLGSFSAPGKQHIRAAEEALERLGISHLRDRSYNRLSGGERQLTLIARALVQNAKVLIMDEPSSNLDFGNRLRVMKTVQALTAQGYTVIQSTHEPEQAYLYSHQILALYEGGVLAIGSPEDVLCDEIISKLYGVPVQVHKLNDHKACLCVPKGESL